MKVSAALRNKIGLSICMNHLCETRSSYKRTLTAIEQGKLDRWEPIEYWDDGQLIDHITQIVDSIVGIIENS